VSSVGNKALIEIDPLREKKPTTAQGIGGVRAREDERTIQVEFIAGQGGAISLVQPPEAMLPSLHGLGPGTRDAAAETWTSLSCR
jgi:hypothetical protein